MRAKYCCHVATLDLSLSVTRRSHVLRSCQKPSNPSVTLCGRLHYDGVRIASSHMRVHVALSRDSWVRHTNSTPAWATTRHRASAPVHELGVDI